MIGDTFTNKWVLGSFVFIVLFGLACYLWYQHEILPYIQEASETTELAQQWESSENTQSKRKQIADITTVNDTLPSTAKSKMINAITDPETKKTDSGEKTGDLKEQTLKTVTDEPVRVSPHGFGPYPKIPDGWPQGFFDRELSREHELLGRVRIKLYDQGISTLGVGIDKHTGKVYPFDKDQVYITFEETFLPPHGMVKYIADILGDADVIRQIQSRAKERNPDMPIPLQIETDIPVGVQVLDKSKGFDPYEFLNFKGNSQNL